MATIIADSMKVKLSGLTNVCFVAKKAPAKPPNIAPIAKAVNFVLVGFTPKDLQAISSSLKASQARPTGSFLIFNVKKYIDSLNINSEELNIYIQRSWATISRGLENIPLHKHYQSHISFAYYLKKNENDSKISFSTSISTP